MKAIFTIISLLIFFLCSSQEDSVTIDFLKQVIKRKNDTTLINYTDKVDAGMYDNMLNQHYIKRKIKDINSSINNSIELSSSEISYLKQQLRKAGNEFWPDSLFPGSRRIPVDSAQSFLYGDRNRDLYFFSRPVFIRKQHIALFYVIHLCCGGIYGPVDLSIYRKAKSEWQKWITISAGAF